MPSVGNVRPKKNITIPIRYSVGNGIFQLVFQPNNEEMC